MLNPLQAPCSCVHRNFLNCVLMFGIMLTSMMFECIASHIVQITADQIVDHTTSLQGYKGHKDLVSGLAFRTNTHQLFSSSFDRSVKLWSLSDGAYMDSLFGHQSEVTSVDVGRQERCVTAGVDRSCRVWKIPEETQMVYRTTNLGTDCVKYAPATELLSSLNWIILWYLLSYNYVCL